MKWKTFTASLIFPNFKVRYCSPSTNSCPKGYSCQYSRNAERNICCGYLGTRAVGRSSISKGTNARKQPKATTDVCDNGTPYILKGVAQACTSAPCPNGFDCTFSKKAQNYFCCNRKARKDMLIHNYRQNLRVTAHFFC